MARDHLRLTTASSTEHVVWARLAAHVIAAAVAAEPGTPLSFFARVMFTPDELRNGET